tara:strand:+ start:2401 stop:2985 length:585 start_codon:yes stop_codon:yes gene_type:complete
LRYNFFLAYILLNILLSNNVDLSNYIFDYSNNNIQRQASTYSLSLEKSQNIKPIHYNISCMPTNNLIINSSVINFSNNDNKIYYSINTGFLFSYDNIRFLKNNIIGMSLNSLKFDANYNNLKWNSYFLINEYKIKKVILNTSISYNFNQNFSLTNFSFFLSKNFYNNFNLGFGINTAKTNKFINNLFFKIRYEL